MIKGWFVSWGVILVMLVLTASPVSGVQDISGAGRLRLDGILVPEWVGSMTVEAALGWGSLSLAGGVDVVTGEEWSLGVRGSVMFSREWLTLSATRIPGQGESSVAARATPDPWRIYDGFPVLMVDVQAGASVVWSEATAQPGLDVTLAPAVQSVMAVRDLVLAPSIRYALRLGHDTGKPQVDGVVLSSTLGGHQVSGLVSLQLDGFFERISGLRVAVDLIALGVTLTGSTWQTEWGQRVVETGFVWEWGDRTRLPARVDGAGSTCIGDVCF